MLALLAILKQYRNSIAAFLLLLTALFLMLSVRTDAIGFRMVQEVLLDIFVPLQKIVATPIRVGQTWQRRLQEWRALDEENQQLKKELIKLRPQQVYIEELLQENRRLRALLRINVGPLYREVAARVIGDSSSAFARVLTIDAGQRDGVRQHTPVVGLAGLVGRVVRAGDRNALVLTLQDINSRIPVVIQRSRIRGIATGNNRSYLVLDFIPKDADIIMDDLVVTSGTGGVFPKGLIVGRVVSISPQGDGLFQTIHVMPSVDLSRIEEVRLLLVHHEAAQQSSSALQKPAGDT
ncbi:MAG: rod shape-determining protein MreC [Magnetococcales bacterium]|nr:rod shape-determining protein MreC [Magnetococcales bacterium]